MPLLFSGIIAIDEVHTGAQQNPVKSTAFILLDNDEFLDIQISSWTDAVRGIVSPVPMQSYLLEGKLTYDTLTKSLLVEASRLLPLDGVQPFCVKISGTGSLHESKSDGLLSLKCSCYAASKESSLNADIYFSHTQYRNVVSKLIPQREIMVSAILVGVEGDRLSLKFSDLLDLSKDNMTSTSPAKTTPKKGPAKWPFKRNVETTSRAHPPSPVASPAKAPTVGLQIHANEPVPGTSDISKYTHTKSS